MNKILIYHTHSHPPFLFIASVFKPGIFITLGTKSKMLNRPTRPTTNNSNRLGDMQICNAHKVNRGRIKALMSAEIDVICHVAPQHRDSRSWP